MSINENILRSIGATEEKYKIGDYIFHENGTPQFYYQLTSGEIKLNNYDSDGKEFIQNILTDEDSVGTSMLFQDKAYPVNAVALSKCSLLKVSKTSFMKILEEQPHLYLRICKTLSDRLYKKYILMRKISCRKASDRLIEVMQMMKQEETNQAPYTFEIRLTRQQLASLSGLCVETTIRTIKKMEKENLVKIQNRKILF